MSAHPHERIDHFLIHVVAALFLFSTISTAFLGYGVYQAEQLDPTYIKPTPALATTKFHSTWTQNSFTGGVSSSSLVVPWNTTGSWNKYASASSLVISNGLGDDGSGNGVFISSIFDLGTRVVSDIRLTGQDSIVLMRGGNSINELNSASWAAPCFYKTKRFIQYKLTDLPTDPAKYVSAVNLNSSYVTGYYTVKDATTGNYLNGATIRYKGNTPPLFIPLGVGRYQAYFEYDSILPESPITISLYGYQPQTKGDKTINFGCSVFDSTIDFSLTKISTSTTSNSKYINNLKLQSTTLPNIFTRAGSKTTDLSKIKDSKKVKDFTLHVPGKSKIVFKDTLNLAGESTVAALEKLDKYLHMGKVGIVDLDSKTLKALNKKATITMEGLKFVREPGILVNGKEDTKGVAGNFNYNKEKGAFTFDVAHFTAFWAIPKLMILTPTTAIIKSNDVDVTGAVSDGAAKVSGQFNGVKLAGIDVDKDTGEFTIKKLSFKEGENDLKLSAESELGSVLPLTQKITFAPAGVVPQEEETPIYKNAFLYFGFAAIILALVLGYLVYRKRKRLE